MIQKNLLFCLVCLSPLYLSAFEETKQNFFIKLEHMDAPAEGMGTFTIEQLKSLDTQDFNEVLTFSKKSTPALFEQMHPYWVHQIASVDNTKHEVTLTDGTTWGIGWWWYSKLNKWEVGDLISIKYDFEASWYHVELFNATRNETVWCELNSINIDASELKWVAFFEDHSMTVVLNDGMRLHENESLNMLSKWREGDLVVPVSVRDRSTLFLHALWNVTQYEMAGPFVILNDIKEN